MKTEIEKLLPGGSQVSIHVQITADVNISAFAARKKVMGFLVDEISTQLRAGEPTLVIGDRIVWRVPVSLTLRSVGEAGEVGTVDVDVETGQLMVDQKTIDDIENRAHYVATRSTHSSA
jgi:hypothetical protein